MTISTRLRAVARRTWDEFFLVVLVGIPIACLVGASHIVSNKGGIPRAVLADNTRGTLFSALVGLAALLLSVMLAVLTILTTMEDRPIVVRFKTTGVNMYRRLVYALLGPVFVSLALATLAVVCIALPSGTPPGTDSASSPSPWSIVAVSVTLGLGATGLAQGAYVASLLARMLVFEGRPPLLTPKDEPKPLVRTPPNTALPEKTSNDGSTERELGPTRTGSPSPA